MGALIFPTLDDGGLLHLMTRGPDFLRPLRE